MFGDPVENPHGWLTKGLMELGSCKNGMNFGAKDIGVTIKSVGVGDIKDYDNIEDIESLTTISLNEMPSEEYMLKDGDLVFVRSNGNKELVGRCVAVYPHETPVSFSGFCIRFRKESSDVLLEYLLRYLKMPEVRAKMAGRGANIQNLNQKILAALQVPVPPLETQMAYVAFVRQSDKSKFSCLKSQFIEMFGDPFENPKGYVKKTIGDVCDFQGGSQPPRKEFVFKPQEGYVRLIQIRDYKTDDYITYAPEKMCRRFCDADDIMIGRYGPPIFQILQGIEGAYNVALMKAIPHGINKEFMRAYLKRDELLHHLELFSTRTAGQSGIEMSELRGYPCLVPPEEEQLQYVEFVKQSDKSK